MEKEWSSILFNVLPYKETDTYILKSPDEASQLLDDHIVMTQSMSFSPYKKPFEQRINSWETKLKLTQVGLPPVVLPSKGALSTKWHLLYLGVACCTLSAPAPGSLTSLHLEEDTGMDMAIRGGGLAPERGSKGRGRSEA